ncbi:MAG TPA: hypothetical protein VMF58_13615 [Rhizomicrobium sp.]|nr:hypothetical protein [Rhizomicrobium sp.]
MSTSSDTQTMERQLAQLLSAVALECSRIGSEISQLGAAASGTAGRKGAAFNIVRMQSFDRLAQNAHAQSSLLAHVAQFVISGTALHSGSLSDAIDNNPVADVRARMRQALGLLQTVSLNGGEEFWGDEDGAESEAASG